MTNDYCSMPMWQCFICGASGEAATAEAASTSGLDHIRRGHPAGLGADSSWEEVLEAKHGLPINEIPGVVYALHYDPPRVVRSVSGDYAGPDPRSNSSGWLSARPVRHYVGWTQQASPRKRIGRHAPLRETEIVHLEPGTMGDEQDLKRAGQCPRCGEPYRDSLAAP